MPSHAYFEKIEQKINAEKWQQIDIPNTKDGKITLPNGEYKYTISLQSAVGVFEGKFTIVDGSHKYIHRIITPNREQVLSWVSDAPPKSDAYESETSELLCLGIFQGNSSFKPYMQDNCNKLVKQNNPKAHYAIGYAYERGIGSYVRNSILAAKSYLKAYNLGEQDAGLAYFWLRQTEPKAVAILLELAEKDNVIATGIAAQYLAGSDKAAEREKALSYAQKAIKQSNPDGLKALSQLNLMRESEGAKYVIEAAAYLNLYSIQFRQQEYNASRLRNFVEEAITPSDLESIAKRTQQLEKEHIKSGLFLYIDTSRFKKLENIKFVVNEDFSFHETQFNSKYLLNLYPTNEFTSVRLFKGDDYVGSATFSSKKIGEQVVCFLPDEKFADSFELKTHQQDARCPATLQDTESMWKVLTQYFN